MGTATDDTIESHLLEYAKEFVKGYSETIEANFLGAKTLILEAGLGRAFFPLYGRKVGVNVALAAFFTQIDFYLFFLEESGIEIDVYREAVADDTSGFGREWTFNAPAERRIQRVKEYLGVEGANVLQPAPSWDAINVPGTNFIASGIAYMGQQGYSHGVSFGNQAGARAESALPRVQEMLQAAADQFAISERYMRLTESDMQPQARGQAFEKLWRDVLDFYGWKPKKIRIPGEDNDFTAIYKGLHILGEVRWFDKRMDGAKMREFLAKLDPRPQSIGLFISYSGVDRGALSVVRRAANSKTVVIFGKADIEKVMRESADPGPIFDERLRDAYDYIFEFTDEGRGAGHGRYDLD